MRSAWASSVPSKDLAVRSPCRLLVGHALARDAEERERLGFHAPGRNVVGTAGANSVRPRIDPLQGVLDVRKPTVQHGRDCLFPLVAGGGNAVLLELKIESVLRDRLHPGDHCLAFAHQHLARSVLEAAPLNCRHLFSLSWWRCHRWSSA